MQLLKAWIRISLLIFISAKQETSSKLKNFFVNDNNTYCFNEAKDDICYFEDKKEETETFYHCQKSNQKTYCFDLEHEETTGYFKCATLKKFFNESCSDKSECLTDICEAGKCAYKTIGDSCKTNKECGLALYCDETMRTCKKYITLDEKEFKNCDEENLCSPQFYCDHHDKRCKKIGAIDNGEPASREEACKSFYLDEDKKCSDNYNLSDPNDGFQKVLAEEFPKIDWTNKNLKLSDYSGDNLGSKKAFLYGLENILKPDYPEIFDCLYDVVIEEYVGMNLYLPGDSRPSITFTDEDIKDLLNYHENGSWIKIGFALICILFLLF